MVQLELPSGEETCAPFVDDAGLQWWLDALRGRGCRDLEIEEIGLSREGRALIGLRAGSGQARASITAGAHADEPSGPLAAMALAWALAGGTPWARDWRSRATFFIAPQVNPDGAQRNREWFSPAADPAAYLRHARREEPGDDVEFGYPGGGLGPLRPENEAVAAFLESGKMYHFHASLHGMACAQGAWFLIGRDWIGRTAGLRRTLAEAAAAAGFQLHDIERRGEKGFERIAPGFCTTPHSAGMRRFFLERGDEATAELFHWSSMEFVRGLGGDPLVMVSELPVFALAGGWSGGPPVEPQPLHAPAPPPGKTPYEQFRDSLAQARNSEDPNALRRLAEEYELKPVPFSIHVPLQIEMVLRGVETAAG